MFTARPLSTRFWQKVYKREGENACWTWVGAWSTNGYGHLKNSDGRSDVRATAVSWFLEHGMWPSKNVLHTCDEPRCVRPSHLFEGTTLDNIRDMMSKGRQNIHKFEQRLFAEDLAVIKANKEGLTQAQLGEKYGITQGHISRIQRGVL